MGKVLKADGSAGNAFAETSPSLWPDHIFVDFDVMIPTATLAALAGAGPPNYFTADVVTIGDGIFLTSTDGVTWKFWFDLSPNPATGTFVADVWHTIRLELEYLGASTWQSTWTLDGSPLATYTFGAASSLISGNTMRVGAFNANSIAGEVYYLDNIKLGTTAGGTDLFSDDFESATFAAWDSETGSVSIVDSPLVAPTPLPHWYVIHREHEFIPDVVGMPDIIDTGAAGTVINTVRPENLHFVLRLGVLGPEDADYELSNTALDEETGDPVIAADFVGAYRTDFEIYRSDIADPILAGMHTEAPAGDDGEQPNDHARIAGKGFLHYLQKRYWPYDADLSYVDWPAGFRFKATAAEVGAMVKDILETVRDVSVNYPLPPDPPGGGAGTHPSYSLGYTVDADDTGVSRNYEIGAFEQSSIYDLVQTLAQAHKDDGGFDFYMTWDKIFKLVSPEIGDPGSPVFALQVDATTHIPNMIAAGFRNVGPDATHMLGVGAGTSTRQGGVNKHSRENSARYRRLDKIADLGDVKNLAELEALTANELVSGVQPVHEIPITVDTADIPDFWTITRPGVYIEVIYDFGWHAVNSVQRIVEMDCNVSLEGVETVALSLNQHYDLDPADGIVDF